MKKAWYASKWVTILLHIAAWVLLFSLPYLLRPSYNPNEPVRPEPASPALVFIAARINDSLLIGFFYLNALLLIPRLLFRKKYILYAISILGCFAAYVFFSRLLMVSFNLSYKEYVFRKHLFFSTFIFLFILACSIAYKTIKDKITADNLAKERENEYLKTELSLLRSQVSPHFMFNVLNNMVALARKQSDLLEPSLIKLSSLMRYMLYETDEQKVSLEKETEYLQSYIDLQRQRFSKKVIINVTMHTADKLYEIEPMLLIPFVENAFKHGTGMIEQASIDIELKAENNNLYFTVSNKYEPFSEEVKDKASGIGLANVQRRLDILYPKHHSLQITKNDKFFIVTLQINLAV
jgi:two-component system, LytTR family, sensor kinase